MATAKPNEERTLKQLLDGILVSQRQDIKAFSGGHLNESNLRKPPEIANRKSWKSAKKKQITLVPRNRFLKTNIRNKNEAGVEDLFQFSLGTSGTIPLPPVQKRQYKGTQGPLQLKSSGLGTSKDRSYSYAKADDGVLVEELKLPELYLRNPKQPSPELLSDRKMDKETPRSFSPMITDKLGNRPDNMPKKQFVQGFQEAVTKRDQFVKLKAFESDVLRIQDANETHVLSGLKAVEKLENKLTQDLSNLQYVGTLNSEAASFQRFEAYQRSFEDVIKSTFTFKIILRQIKKEYDDYLAHLLASRPDEHRRLHHQMEQLSARGSSNPRMIRFESERVLEMEKEAKDLLLENEKLRRELHDEMVLIEESNDEEKITPLPTVTERPTLELADKIEELHSSLLERLDKISDLRKQHKTDYVPASVCTHLEQCVKETEIELQRLTSQKEYFEKNIAEMEGELQNLIETADTTDKDAKRVWRRINAVKAINRGGQTIFGYDSDSETEEEAKWNWYIS